VAAGQEVNWYDESHTYLRCEAGAAIVSGQSHMASFKLVRFRQCFDDDGLNRRKTAPAIRTAAETFIESAGRRRAGFAIQRSADFRVRKNVAGAYDHWGTEMTIRVANRWRKQPAKIKAKPMPLL
jgi:hypothetical protein